MELNEKQMEEIKKIAETKVVDFLSDKEKVSPYEREIIRTETKKYNILITLVAVLGIVAFISLGSSIVKITADKAYRDLVEQARHEVDKKVESQTRIAIDFLSRQIGFAQHETEDYKKHVFGITEDLYDRGVELEQKIIPILSKCDTYQEDITTLLKNADSTSNELQTKIEKAGTLYGTLESQTTKTKDLIKNLRILSDKKDEFEEGLKYLDKFREKKLYIKQHKNTPQYSFNLGNLLLLFGIARTDDDGEKTIAFADIKFRNKDELYISINNLNRKLALSPLLIKRTNENFKCKFKIDGADINEKIWFNYLVIGRPISSTS